MPSSYLWAFSSCFHGDRCCLAGRLTARWPCLDQGMTPVGSYLIPFSCFAAEALAAASCHAPHRLFHRPLFPQFSKEMAIGGNARSVILFHSDCVLVQTSSLCCLWDPKCNMEKTTSSCNGSLSFSCLLFAGQNGISCLCCFHFFFLLASCSSFNCWCNF